MLSDRKTKYHIKVLEIEAVILIGLIISLNKLINCISKHRSTCALRGAGETPDLVPPQFLLLFTPIY